MKVSEKMSIFIWWIFVPACVVWFAYLIFLAKLKLEFKDYIKTPVKTWSDSSHPKAALFTIIERLQKNDKTLSEKEILKAIELDPANGFIDALILSLSVDSCISTEKDYVKNTEDITITNDNLFEKCTVHFEAIAKKENYTTYRLDFFKLLRPNPQQTFQDTLKNLDALYSIPKKELSAIISFNKAYLLFGNPDDDELLRRCRLTLKIAEKLALNANEIIEQAVSYSITKVTHDYLVKENSRKENDLFKSLIQKLKKYESWRYLNYERNRKIKQYFNEFSSLAKMSVPHSDLPDDFRERLYENRMLEYSYYDSIAACTQLLVILIIIAALYLIILRWDFSQLEEKPCLSFPDKKHMLQGLSAIILISAVYIISKKYLGSKDLGVFSNTAPWLYGSEMLAFALLSILLSMHLILKGFNKSSEVQKIPPQKNSIFIILSPAVATILLSVFLRPKEDTFITVTALLTVIYPLFLVIYYFKMILSKEYGYWYGLVARLAIIILCTYGLIISLVYLPLAKMDESYFYQNDYICGIAYEENLACTKLEAYAVNSAIERLKVIDKLPVATAPKNHMKTNNLKLRLADPVIKEEVNDSDNRERRRNLIRETLSNPEKK